MKTIEEVIGFLEAIRDEYGPGLAVRVAHPDSGTPLDIEIMGVMARVEVEPHAVIYTT